MSRRVTLAGVWLALSRDALRRAFDSETRDPAARLEALGDALRFALYAYQAGDTAVELDDDLRTTWDRDSRGELFEVEA